METEEDMLQEEPVEQDTRVDIDAVTMAVCEKCGCEIDVEGIDSFDEVECPDCSERVTVPAKLGPFLLTRMLGAGGMGAVYVAKDEALGRQVAIKVMLKELGEDVEFIAAFKREAQAAAKEVLRLNPKFSVARMQKVSPHKDRAVAKRFCDALRKAGLPD